MCVPSGKVLYIIRVSFIPNAKRVVFGKGFSLQWMLHGFCRSVDPFVGTSWREYCGEIWSYEVIPMSMVGNRTLSRIVGNGLNVCVSLERRPA